jgi:hypothetical protein
MALIALSPNRFPVRATTGVWPLAPQVRSERWSERAPNLVGEHGDRVLGVGLRPDLRVLDRCPGVDSLGVGLAGAAVGPLEGQAEPGHELAQPRQRVANPKVRLDERAQLRAGPQQSAEPELVGVELQDGLADRGLLGRCQTAAVPDLRAGLTRAQPGFAASLVAVPPRPDRLRRDPEQRRGDVVGHALMEHCGHHPLPQHLLLRRRKRPHVHPKIISHNKTTTEKPASHREISSNPGATW